MQTSDENKESYPLHPNIIMHILPIVHHTFLKVLTRRICLRASLVGDHFLYSLDLLCDSGIML